LLREVDRDSGGLSSRYVGSEGRGSEE